MKKIFIVSTLFILTFSFTAYSARKNDDRSFRKCSDDCMTKRTRCIKEGNRGKKSLYSRGYCDNNFRQCNNDCIARFSRKK